MHRTLIRSLFLLISKVDNNLSASIRVAFRRQFHIDIFYWVESDIISWIILFVSVYTTIFSGLYTRKIYKYISLYFSLIQVLIWVGTGGKLWYNLTFKYWSLRASKTSLDVMDWKTGILHSLKIVLIPIATNLLELPIYCVIENGEFKGSVLVPRRVAPSF